VTDDPFVTLVVESLNLMHPRFAAGNGRRAFLFEFYHQFRHLWDRAVPGQLGLGHVVVQSEPGMSGSPDFFFWQVGERGEPDRRLGAVLVGMLSDAAEVEANLIILVHLRKAFGYPHAVNVVVGRAADIPASGLPQTPGVTVVFFDTDRWQVVRV
jgi:hypothetical protein